MYRKMNDAVTMTKYTRLQSPNENTEFADTIVITADSTSRTCNDCTTSQTLLLATRLREKQLKQWTMTFSLERMREMMMPLSKVFKLENLIFHADMQASKLSMSQPGEGFTCFVETTVDAETCSYTQSHTYWEEEEVHFKIPHGLGPVLRIGLYHGEVTIRGEQNRVFKDEQEQKIFTISMTVSVEDQDTSEVIFSYSTCCSPWYAPTKLDCLLLINQYNSYFTCAIDGIQQIMNLCHRGDNQDLHVSITQSNKIDNDAVLTISMEASEIKYTKEIKGKSDLHGFRGSLSVIVLSKLLGGFNKKNTMLTIRYAKEHPWMFDVECNNRHTMRIVMA
jgi:hypothetical protein